MCRVTLGPHIATLRPRRMVSSVFLAIFLTVYGSPTTDTVQARSTCLRTDAAIQAREWSSLGIVSEAQTATTIHGSPARTGILSGYSPVSP